jgi:O-antigen ligase
VAIGCLLPSMPAANPPRPALALVGLAAGLTLAAVSARLPRRLAVAVPVCVLLVACLGALILGARGADGPVGSIAQARANLASPDRSAALHAALRLTAAHPLTGTGPGQAELRWRGSDGVIRFFGYAHNEYVQSAAEIGLVGLTLLAVLLGTLARLLWAARATAGQSAAEQPAAGQPAAGQPAAGHPAVWAGAVAATAAFAVHSGFDFVWHLPAVVFTVLLVTGAVLPAPAHTDASRTSQFSREESYDSQTTS